MRFDPLSFLMGLLAGGLLGLIAWRTRRRLARIHDTAEAQIEGTRRFVGQAADARYARDLVRTLQGRHLAGSLCLLSEVLLEPRLILPPPPELEPAGEDTIARSVFDVVPLFHDMPQSYAPYNIETIPLADLGAGDRQVAILGASGMGKSVTLTTLALMALGEVTFESLEDLSAQAILAEERDLPEEEQRARAAERQRIQQRAMERLYDARQQRREQLGLPEEERLPPLDLTTLTPVLVHLSDVELDATAFGKARGAALDPAEPLVRAAQRQLGAVAARVAGSVIYPALERGSALVLIDGYDELSPAAREPYLGWLSQLAATYGQNLIVVAGPPSGYERLTACGFTPTFLRAWRDEDYALLAERWTQVWGRAHRRAPALDDKEMRRLTQDNRGRSALDVTLIAVGGAGRRHAPDGPPGLVRCLRHAPPEQRPASPGAAPPGRRPGHGGRAAAARRAGRGPALRHEREQGGRGAGRAGQGCGPPPPPRPREERGGGGGKREGGGGALGFAAGRINILPVIYRKLSAPPDLFYSNLFGLVRWLPDAPPDAPWRGDIFTRFAKALLASEQYPLVRERALAALIASRDRNVLFILRQALHAADADIRRLGCVGLGALGNPEAVKDLAALLADESQRVKLAAALALGAIGSEQAIEMMIHGLFQEGHEVRRAIAEALAALPGNGHNILREAIVAQEVEIRRAAVYGLSRVRAPWALIALYRAMMEDEQWVVRTVAQEAFAAAQSAEREGPRRHPEADSLGWLIAWAADRGEGVPAGPNARQVLVRVLQEGQTVYKTLAAYTLARLGYVPALKPLYAALRDRDPAVRGAAYAALAELQTQLGRSLPGVV
ncbi:MAG: HEAT repeat domain-containing protein [Anaerolineae bacterium]|nr:HEAT repeat domain-containing protein [Anaerolineae bacterium]